MPLFPAARGPRLPRSAVLVGSLLVAACDPANQGIAPPANVLFFPSGMLLDRRGPAVREEPPKWLFVANGNNDLSYSSGTVVAIDLDAFFAAWTADQHTMEVDPYCGEDRCVLNRGSDMTDEDEDGLPDRPCRRLALRPSVVECDEKRFIKSSVQVGDFATLLTSSCEPTADGGCEHSRLWLPVRGDPSVTYMDLRDENGNGVPELFCLDEEEEQAAIKRGDPIEELAATRCGSDVRREKGGASYRLTYRRNDKDLPEIDREPFHMAISPSFRYGYVAHADSQTLTVVALDGLRKATGNYEGAPAIIDSAPLFADPGGLTGGFGIAERPCNVDGNAPSLTNRCTRPLVYGSYRYLRALVSFTVQGVEFDDPTDMALKCLGPNEDIDEGKLNCDPQVRSVQRLFPGGLDPQSTSFRPTLGDMAFGDDEGNELFVVQTAPGALLKLDTSLGPDGEPLDTPSAPPIEICEEPTRMKLYREGGQRFAFISCFRAALIYIVDLDAFRVVHIVIGGTGPYELEVDDERDLLYVANSLERSISVIDLARHRKTRFEEIARIGLQDPFMR